MIFLLNNYHLNILMIACQNGYLDIVKYIVSLNKFDLTETTIYFFFNSVSIFFNSAISNIYIFITFNN